MGVYSKMNNSVFSVFLAVLVLLSVDRVSGNFTKIVGGNNAPPEFGHFHASIQNLTGYHVCGGAVVSKWLVVTVAHCLYGASPAYIKIVSGTNHLGIGGKQHDVATIFIHDNYNRDTRENDIALLKTTRPFDLRHISIIKISARVLVEGDEVFVTGFGAKEVNGLSSCQMQSLNLTVFNQEICKYALRYATTPVTQDMFCTFSTVGEGTCHGDSGSPVVNSKRELVGVVSWGIPCAVGFPDVHTRISPYVEWIQEHISRADCGRRKVPIIFQKLEFLARHSLNVPKELKNILATENP